MLLILEVRRLHVERRYDIVILMVAALFPLYGSFVSVVVLFMLNAIAIWMYWFLRKEQSRSGSYLRLIYFFASCGFFLLMTASLIYSTNFSKGLSFLVSNSYLLFYPFAMFLLIKNITEEHIRLVMVSFIFACCLYAIKMHFDFYNAGLYTEFRNAEYNDLPFRQILSDHKGHPTYVSMWFVFCALFLTHLMFKLRVSAGQRVLCILVILFLTSSTILLSTKITFIAFFFALLVLIYQVFRKKLIVITAYVGAVLIFVLAVFNISFLKSRFIDEYKSAELAPPIGLHTNSLNIRIGIWKCSIKVFRENWLLGTGIGDVQPELDNCYSSFDTDVYKEGVYNTHNNFLAVAVSTGIIGLISFVFMLGFHLVHSLRNNNTLFVLFLVVVVICMLTENILSRNHGVVFYSLFCTLLSKLNQQRCCLS